jgi:hypothetical protein
MSLGGWGMGGGLEYPLPPMKFLLKATFSPPKILIFLDQKYTFFQKFFWTFRDFHKSAVKFSKKI